MATCQQNGLYVRHNDHYDGFAEVFFQVSAQAALPQHFSLQVTATALNPTSAATFILGVHQQNSGVLTDDNGYGDDILYQYYDAVVIDEAQDLDPSMLRLLVNLCKQPGRLFITADANQSIYGSGFTWTDVHGSLRFQGRTSVLRANYRSTYEIGEAAQSYLSDGVLDSEIGDRHYVNNGPLPDVRAIQNGVHEGQLLANFFKKASLNLRLTYGSCAVLCPSERAGKTIADALRAQGIEATFMSGQDLNLARSGVKVLTLNAAKGLEFPIVALAGFLSGGYPVIPHDASTDERDEILARERRTMFVGMTRAMRALLVIVPVNVKTPLLQGFDGSYWNMR